MAFVLKKNNKKTLFFWFIILGFLFIGTIYYLTSQKGDRALQLPKSLTNYEIESNIKSKTVDPVELDFVMSQYATKIDSNYILNPNIKIDEKDKLKSILIKNGFYIDNTERGIETPIKKIINGYLGQFLRFQYFNNINWLILPIFLYIAATFKKRQRWEFALMFFYVLSSIIIGIGGYINFRYGLTLLPLTLIIIFYYLYEITEDTTLKSYRKYLIIILLLLIIFNTFRYNLDFIKQTQQYFNNDKSTNKNQDTKSIQEMVNFINNFDLPKGTKILNNNLPFLYYYTSKPAVYYLAEIDTFYTDKGSKALTLGIPINSLPNFIKNELKCNYILSSHLHNEYNQTFKKFLENYTTVVFENGDYIFYKIK
ncbi:MAG: hypothetical protein PHS06_02455 [Candidatus Shapirobacteria bacterium]|nr:hypothetical protein [Candidatus Shapirobacteria bacterium]